MAVAPFVGWGADVKDIRGYVLLGLALLLAMGCQRDPRVYGEQIDTNGDGIPDGYGYGDNGGYGDDGSSYGGSSDGSNGGPGGGGTGAGGVGFNGPWGDVTAYFLNLLGNLPSYWQSGWPHHFRWSGPRQIQVFTCNAYQLELRTVGNGTAYVPSGQTLQTYLTDSAFGTTNGGAFFSDSRCQKGVAMVEFKSGESTKVVYYSRAMVLGNFLLKADARFQAWNVIGRYHIASVANPKYQLPICFNFEDLHGRADSDEDYNDAVLQTPAGSLFATNDKTVEAYNNETVTLKGWGTSACDSQIDVEQYRRGQRISAKTIASARAGGTVTFAMQYQDRLVVSFTAKGFCASGKHPATDSAVRVSNRCRTSADEGQRWQ